MDKTPLRPWDKILPTQAFNSGQYRDGVPFEKALYDSIMGTCGLRTAAEEFDLEITDKFTVEEMASSPVSLGFLRWLIAVSGASRVLEIGTFIGVSAMSFAKALPDGGEVMTLEKFAHFADIARRNFARNGLDRKIRLLVGDASDLIPSLPDSESFDLVFVDGNKERYADYVAMTGRLVRPGGVIAVDDTFFHGDALNREPRSEKGAGVRRCLELAATLTDWRRAMLPVSNGLLLLMKPAASAAGADGPRRR